MAAKKIRIRLYNVLLGDAILVSVPDAENGKPKTRHILIDFGNKYNDEGSDDSVFEPVFDDIVKQLKGEPLDLYVMTHEHLDHNQGLLYVSSKLNVDVKAKLQPRHVWLTASAHPDYYDTHPEAEKQMQLAVAAYDEVRQYLGAVPDESTPFAETLLALNNPRRTKDCVDFARELNPDNTHYVHRGVKLAGKHDFEVAKFSVWAPEEDSSIYYGRNEVAPLFAGAPDGGVPTPTAVTQPPIPPPGVDASAFYDLVRSRLRGIGNNLLAIDKANNDTSIVFCLEWNGHRLLFTGDAEERSWVEMDERKLLKPVHFLKISHHGSHNGTPGDDLLEKILPLQPDDDKPRYAAVSTCLHAYNGIPHSKTIADVKKRVKKVYSTLDDSEVGKWVDVKIG
jgi:beta-lactamase superfamily II metal-dependent hydrolase